MLFNSARNLDKLNSGVERPKRLGLQETLRTRKITVVRPTARDFPARNPEAQIRENVQVQWTATLGPAWHPMEAARGCVVQRDQTLRTIMQPLCKSCGKLERFGRKVSENVELLEPSWFLLALRQGASTLMQTQGAIYMEVSDFHLLRGRVLHMVRPLCYLASCFFVSFQAA